MRRKWSVTLCVVLCAAFLFFVGTVLFFGAAEQETLPYVPLLSDEDGTRAVLAVGSVGADAVAVFSAPESATLLRCNAEGVQAQVDLQIPLDWAAVAQDRILLKSDGILLQYDPISLGEMSQRELPYPAEDILSFACDQTGAMYTVLSQSRNCVQISLPDGTERTETLPGEITGFSAFLQGVWVWAQGDLRMLSGEESREFKWPIAPLAAFDGNRFLDWDGLFCTCEAGEVFPLFRCEQEPYPGLNFSMDAEGSLLIAEGEAILWYGGDGTLLKRCELAGIPDALIPDGAIFHRDGSFCFAAFASLPQESKPSESEPSESEPPEETPEPGPTPGAESETPPLLLEDDCIIVQYGMTVQELRELFKPEAVEIRDRTGRLLTAGKLATGMTANDFSIVLEGDVNGSGTVTESDLREAIEMYLQQGESGPQFRAADLSGDGLIDTRDLLLLSRLIEELRE